MYCGDSDSQQISKNEYTVPLTADSDPGGFQRYQYYVVSTKKNYYFAFLFSKLSKFSPSIRVIRIYGSWHNNVLLHVKCCNFPTNHI